MKRKIWFICNWDEIYDPNVSLRTIRNWPITNNLELSETEYEFLIVLGGIRPQDMKYYRNPIIPSWNYL